MITFWKANWRGYLKFLAAVSVVAVVALMLLPDHRPMIRAVCAGVLTGPIVGMPVYAAVLGYIGADKRL